MDGDTAYTTRRKGFKTSWTLLTSTFALIILLCALCLFFFFHPRTWNRQVSSIGRDTLSSTDTILDEISNVDYMKLDTVDTMGIRLPTNVVPESYNLKIVPYLWAGNYTFDGQVDIVVNVTAPTDSIILHAVDMNMTECLVTRSVPP